MMKLGVVSAILPNLSFEEVIDYASGVGFTCVEMCCWPQGKAARRYAGVTHIDLNTLTEEKIAYYLQYAKERNVTISSLAYYPNPLTANEEEAEIAISHIMKLIDAADAMGIGMITTFIGKDPAMSVENNLDKFEKVWAPIVAHAETKKVRIGIENCPMYYTENEWPGGANLASTPYIWREMFRRIPSDYLGLNFDPSHPYLLGASYTKPLYEFKDKIFHVHFKDIYIDPVKVDEFGRFSHPGLWHSPKLPGMGGVDFGAFCSALNDIGYKGYACIEVEDRAFEANIEDVKSGIEQSYRYMRQYL